MDLLAPSLATPTLSLPSVEIRRPISQESSPLPRKAIYRIMRRFRSEKQTTPPSFWAYLKLCIEGEKINRKIYENLKNNLPIRFRPFNPKFKPTSAPVAVSFPEEELCITKCLVKGTYQKGIWYIRYADEESKTMKRRIYVLKKVHSQCKEDLGLRQFGKYFPSPLKANMGHQEISLKFTLSEFVWEEDGYTWQLLHAAQGPTLCQKYGHHFLPSSKGIFNLIPIADIYKELGLLVGQFFKRYQNQPSPLKSEERADGVYQDLFSAPWWDLHPHNVFYNPEKRQFTAIDLSLLGATLPPKRHIYTGLLDSLFCILMHKDWIEIFMNPCGHTKAPKLKSWLKDVKSRDTIYKHIQNVYDSFFNGFTSVWSSRDDQDSLKEYFASAFIFPYRKIHKAFEGEELTLKPYLQERTHYFLDRLYPCLECKEKETEEENSKP